MSCSQGRKSEALQLEPAPSSAGIAEPVSPYELSVIFSEILLTSQRDVEEDVVLFLMPSIFAIVSRQLRRILGTLYSKSQKNPTVVCGKSNSYVAEQYDRFHVSKSAFESIKKRTYTVA